MFICTEVEAPKFKGAYTVFTLPPLPPHLQQPILLGIAMCTCITTYIMSVTSFTWTYTCILLNEGFVKQRGYVQQCFRQSIMKLQRRRRHFKSGQATANKRSVVYVHPGVGVCVGVD